ncbi:unnamed protein product [Danaus chrysippus]|uniref:(African queen) hypothetical protein n=1 Tax=Danaus chrysippus TaxID=151541 RepID=A0A8J2QPQ8_9NEOP|nr:unnamed protein product [Danaus chrysippus]
MKAFFVLLVVFAIAFVASAENEESSEFIHEIEKRQIIKPITITAKPPFTPCVFYECIARCRQRGYRNGGYCTINGCQCLR